MRSMLNDGIIAYKIAAHLADIARHSPRDRDDSISHARYILDQDKRYVLSLDPETACSISKSLFGATRTS
jgi:phosphomethylpyrimidine synthase